MKSNFLVRLDDREIRVLVSNEVFTNLPSMLGRFVKSSHYYLLVDAEVARKYRVMFDNLFINSNISYFIIDGQKSSKSFATAMNVFADLNQKNVSRDVALVAIGGGVVGDLGGFVASLWYRGVELVHVPTTLLAAVDSCLGGKTALNFRQTANAVGTYHQPSSILIDPTVLAGLPEREISSGFGEVIKYAVLGSPEILAAIEPSAETTAESLADLVGWSLQMKANFVEGDVQESNKRLYLNFGHTIGHAIEFSTTYNGRELFRHGEGVALGMLAAFRICVALGYLEEVDVRRLRGIIQSHGLPTEMHALELHSSRESLVDQILGAALKDKKRTKDGLRLVLLNGWGNPFLHHTSDVSLIRAGIEEVVK